MKVENEFANVAQTSVHRERGGGRVAIRIWGKGGGKMGVEEVGVESEG